MVHDPVQYRRHDRDGKHSGRLHRIPVAILQGPFEFCVAILSAMLGLGVLVTAFFPVVEFTRMQSELPLILVLGWAVFLLVGGLGTVISIFRREHAKGSALVEEVTALVLLAAGWAVYGLAPLATGRWSPVIISGCIITATALRIYAIIIAVRVTKETQALRAELAKER